MARVLSQGDPGQGLYDMIYTQNRKRQGDNNMLNQAVDHKTQYIIREEPVWRFDKKTGRRSPHVGTRWFETLPSAMNYIKLYGIDRASLVTIPPASTLAELVPCPHSSSGDTRKRWEVVTKATLPLGPKAKTRREAIRAEADITELLCEVCTGQRPASHMESGIALLRTKLMGD